MKNFLSLLLMLSIYTVGLCQNPLTNEKTAQLDSIATQDVPDGAPGIATAIILDGNVIYENYVGLADLLDSTMVTGKTRFNIASNGKQFTALAILNLINEKKLALVDDIRKWFPAIYPEVEENITVQHLLNHTSGIRDVYDIWSLQGYTWWEYTFDNTDVLNLIQKQTELNFSPGTTYLYSNTNYILLALIVEKITEQTFSEYTNEMFKALKMPNTSFESDYTSIRGSIAKPYFNFGTWTTFEWIWNVVGDGALFSTLEDQIQWEKLIHGNGDTSFDRSLITLSQQPIENSIFNNYGYGLEFGTYKGLDYTFHEGATGAWKATVLRFPEENISMITLTNSGKTIPYSQTRSMADIVFDLKSYASYLITKPAKVGEYITEQEIVGTYLTDNNFAFTFELKENKLFLKRVGRNDVELERESANIFQQKFDPDFKQEFTWSPEGELQVTAYYTTHAPYTLTKVRSLPDDFAFNVLNGDYTNYETSTNVGIRHRENNTFNVTFREDYTTTGLLVSEDTLLVDFYTFEFKDGFFLLNGDRIKKVTFTKR